jgi:ABC-type transport system substrate-binding protein
MTWEAAGDYFGCLTTGCWTPLDPTIAYSPSSEQILSNVYEPLLWYNGTSSSQVIPWLAKSYSVSPNDTTVSFELRNNITFADGQPLNSSDVYFSLNRLLIEDGNTAYGTGAGPSWSIQQLLNENLSTLFSGSQNYSRAWVAQVLGQNFVQITGPLTFNLHLQNPTLSLPYLLAEPWAAIMEPTFVMTHDLALWSASNSSYREENLLPYPTLTGSLTNQMTQYFDDEVSTCNVGSTPIGCADTYLDTSTSGSLAGTGPYIIESVSINQSVTLQARDDYWGGPYQFLGGHFESPQIQTVLVKNVPLQSDRTRDLESAASQGKAMMMDLQLSLTLGSSRLFDIANQTDWLSHGELVSVFPSVTISGPFTTYNTLFDQFVTNVTLPSQGGSTSYEQFQPFADLRLRLAFADAVDLYSIDATATYNQGEVATNAIPPGLPPAGAYNSSDLPRYRYDPDAIQSLLLSAMMSPIQSFHFFNGTVAPAGLFNNTFGCTQLDAKNQCTSPVSKSIVLTTLTGDTPNIAIMNQIASTINNASLAFNMGLHVYVQTVPLSSYADTGNFYMYSYGWLYDYPWVGDFVKPLFSPTPFAFLPSDGWNVSSISSLWTEFANADSHGNLSGVITTDNELNGLANRMVIYLWTFYPYAFFVHTSNIEGFFYNPSLFGQPFITLSIERPSVTISGFLTGYVPTVAAALAVSLIVILTSLYVTRRKRGITTASQEGRKPQRVTPASTIESDARPALTEPLRPEPTLKFENPQTGVAFDYLVSSFIDDYMRKRMYSEQSGWRSLIQISQACQLPQGLLYGRGGRRGPVTAELIGRGLVEARTFSGQRGRGGDVVKVRVAYDKEPVKKFVDETAMKL